MAEFRDNNENQTNTFKNKMAQNEYNDEKRKGKLKELIPFCHYHKRKKCE